MNRPGDRNGIGSGNVNIGNVNIGNSIDFSKDSRAWINERHNVGNRVRRNASSRYARVYGNGGYRRGLVGGYPYYQSWGTRDAYYAWRAPTRQSFTAFLGPTWTSASPAYYAYGAGGNVYYENNVVYVNGQASGTPSQYAQQTINVVAAAPEPEEVSQDAEWMPLGVFAFTQENVDDSQTMVELAVNKDGVIAGSYYNEATEVSRPLKGAIDKATQRAIIGFADGKSDDTVLEVGMYNLTEAEAPGLLHLGTEISTPILLVRLDAPQ